MGKLHKEELVTLHTLKSKGQSNRSIAKQLDVSESVVRYHLKRKAANASDGRRKASLVEKLGLIHVIAHWWKDQIELLPKDRNPNIQALYHLLVEQYDYSGSYKSIRKYVRKTFEKPKQPAFRRVETPPGAQAQSDWMEQTITIDGEQQKIYGFVMTLSHSRKTVVIWSRNMNQLAWHHVHNEAFKRLGGVPAMNRIDNLKTGVASGSGANATINSNYAAYARTMGFHVDPHQARAPQQKGKVERRVRAVRQKLDLNQNFESLESLQSYTDDQLVIDSKRRTCPVTGKSIHDTWQDEQKLLHELPETLPEPFDLVRTCQVHKDCTIRFEGRTYSVPFRFAYDRVEVRGCNGFLQIVDPQSGVVVQQYPRNTEQKLLITPDHYEGESTAEVSAPLPLGQVAKKLQQLAEEEVQTRSIDCYARLVEVAQ